MTTDTENPRPATRDHGQAAGPRDLRRRAWRWHFLAALLVIPFVLWQSVTGTLYLWSEHWVDQRHPDLRFVTPGPVRAPLDVQLQAARALYPDLPVAGILVPHDVTRSTQITFNDRNGLPLAAFVDPLVATGHRVVLFDGPSHGDSDPGPAGRGRTHGVELGRALDAVAARFGPAEAVVAHSLGTIATYLALRFGSLGTRRLVLVAPMVEASSLFDGFQAALGFGERTRAAFDRAVDRLVGISVAEFDARVQAAHADPIPTLVVHDVGDRQTSYDDARALAAALPDARFVTTEGLGHRRILRDPDVVTQVAAFIAGRDQVEAA